MTIFNTSFITHLTNFSSICISGPDAAQFLQGQVTCDVREIDAHTSRLGGICNPQGRVQAIFILLQWHTDYYLVLPTVLAPLILERLKKYILLSKVTLAIADTIQIFGLRGESINKLDLSLNQKNYAISTNTVSCLIHLPDTVPCALLLTHANYAEKISHDFATINVNQEHWHYYQLQQTIPQLCLATYEKLTPHDLNLPKLGAVSFKKGCYCGQEIIARMEYRAKLKQHAYLAEWHSMVEPQIGMTLSNQEPLQTALIIDVVSLTHNRYLVLVFLQDQAVHLQKLAYDHGYLLIDWADKLYSDH